MNEILRMIMETDTKIQKLEAQLQHLRSYRSGLEAAHVALATGGIADSVDAALEEVGSGLRRPLSAHWKEILGYIGLDGKSIDDINSFAELQNYGLSRSNVRSQIHALANRTEPLLERFDENRKVRLTKKGVAASTNPFKSEGPAASTAEPSRSTTPAGEARTQSEDLGQEVNDA